MKATLTYAATILASLSISAPVVFAKTVSVDLARSQLRWSAKKVTGNGHTGTVALKAGRLEVDGSKIKGGSFEVDMASIADEDLKDPEYNAKLVNHLKSDDFFGVAQHPVSTFKITSIKPRKGGQASDGATHEIAGDLTIKGQTHPVTFPVKLDVQGGEARAKGKLTVDRTLYNVRYGSGKFFQNLGDKMIDDQFELDLDLTSKL